MKLSKQDLFSDGQTLPTTQGDHASDDTLDWGAHKDDHSRFLTLFAKCDGIVKFERLGKDKKQVSVYPQQA